MVEIFKENEACAVDEIELINRAQISRLRCYLFYCDRKLLCLLLDH